MSPNEYILSNYLTTERFNQLVSKLDLENGRYQNLFQRIKAHVDKFLDDDSIYANHPYVLAINAVASGETIDPTNVATAMETFVLPESIYDPWRID